METVANRNFYKSRIGDIRIRIRAFDDNSVKAIRSCEELCGLLIGKTVKFAKKPELKNDAESVIEYNFVEMPYDNVNGKDRLCHHAVVIVENHNDAKDVVSQISVSLGSKNINVSSKKINDKSYSVSVGFPIKACRGLWVDDSVDSSVDDVKFPLCIISYKRSNDLCGLTHLTLCRMKLKHYIFVEPFEYDDYVKWADCAFAVVVSSGEDFSETKKIGSSPMRNFALDWGLSNGFERIWMLDDNIVYYQRFHQSSKVKIESAQVFSSVEHYVDRFSNVGIVSHNFSPLIREGDKRAVIVKNGKCYSSLLIPTAADIRFRYKHQEDNLISIEYIQKGFCTLCFNHVQYSKHTSGTDRGGNREVLYKCDGVNLDGIGYKDRYEFFESALSELYKNGKLPLRPELQSQGVSAFLSRATNINSKEYHARCDYRAFVQPECTLKSYPDSPKPERLILLEDDIRSVVGSVSSLVSKPDSGEDFRDSDDHDVVCSSCSSCDVYKARIVELEAKFALLQSIIMSTVKTVV